MTLPELCEPVFGYFCRLNRMAREGRIPDYAVVHAELKALLQDLAVRAGPDASLRAQAQKIELPLLFFVDSMIAESGWPIANRWNEERLAYERDERTGDERFWSLLDECLEDRSEEATERLVVFYTCLGLGFAGSRAGQPELVRTTLMTLTPRIRRWIDADQTARLFPEAYENIDTRDLVERPNRKLLVVGVTLGICAAAVFAAHVMLYRNAVSDIETSIGAIQEAGDPSP